MTRGTASRPLCAIPARARPSRLAQWTFGAGAPAEVLLERGREEVGATLRWLASRWSDCTDQRLDLVAAGVNGDLADLSKCPPQSDWAVSAHLLPSPADRQHHLTVIHGTRDRCPAALLAPTAARILAGSEVASKDPPRRRGRS